MFEEAMHASDVAAQRYARRELRAQDAGGNAGDLAEQGVYLERALLGSARPVFDDVEVAQEHIDAFAAAREPGLNW
jgi:hypothetical protein